MTDQDEKARDTNKKIQDTIIKQKWQKEKKKSLKEIQKMKKMMI